MKQYELELNGAGELHRFHTRGQNTEKLSYVFHSTTGVKSVGCFPYEISFRIAKMFDADAVIREIETKLDKFYKEGKPQ